MSAVFGTLQYLTLPARLCVALSVLRGAFGDDTFPDADSADVCDVELWPNLADNGRIEPDVVITVRKAQAPPNVVLLIEAKWNAPQGDGQLSGQWNAAHDRYKNAELWHLFLTKNPQTVEEMLQPGKREGEHAQHLRSVTWSWLAQRLRMASLDSKKSADCPGRDELQRWADAVCKCCARLGQAPFEGVTAAIQRHIGGWPANTWCFRERLMRGDRLIESARNVITTWRYPAWEFQERRT